jgi:hypothetical protein
MQLNKRVFLNKLSLSDVCIKFIIYSENKIGINNINNFISSILNKKENSDKKYSNRIKVLIKIILDIFTPLLI